MKLLLKQDNSGKTVDGDKPSLVAAIKSGSEVVLFIENNVYPEWIVFNGFLEKDNEAFGLSRPHLAGGRDTLQKDTSNPFSIQYFYGIDMSLYVFRTCLATGKTRSNQYHSVSHYISYSWFETETYSPVDIRSSLINPSALKFKFQNKYATLIGRPDILYFQKDYLPNGDIEILKIKSEEFSIPEKYLTGKESSLAYSCFFQFSLSGDNYAVTRNKFDSNKGLFKPKSRRRIKRGTPSYIGQGAPNVLDIGGTITYLSREKIL